MVRQSGRRSCSFTLSFRTTRRGSSTSRLFHLLAWRTLSVLNRCSSQGRSASYRTASVGVELGSFKLLDVGGREPGCPCRGCILSDAALCSNVDCSQILLFPTPGTTDHDMKEVGSPKHLLAHLFYLGAEGHTTIVRYAQDVSEGVQLGGTPLMVIWGRHCASALSRLKKATSHFAALRVRRDTCPCNKLLLTFIDNAIFSFYINRYENFQYIAHCRLTTKA